MQFNIKTDTPRQIGSHELEHPNSEIGLVESESPGDTDSNMSDASSELDWPNSDNEHAFLAESASPGDADSDGWYELGWPNSEIGYELLDESDGSADESENGENVWPQNFVASGSVPSLWQQGFTRGAGHGKLF